MKRTLELAPLALLVLALGVVLPSCDEDEAPKAPVVEATKTPEPTKPVVANPEATDAAALTRAREFWALAEKPDWIAAYDYLAPELQREQPIAEYLQRKAHHIYKAMRVTEVVARKDDQIFLRVTGQWTPNHPEVRRVKLEPGQTLTQEVEMIELWKWSGDQWRMLRPMRADEFLEQYPDIQAKPK